MKSAWDLIFSSDSAAPLSDQDREQALRELAKAVTEIAEVQASPEHERIAKLIAAKMSQPDVPAD